MPQKTCLPDTYPDGLINVYTSKVYQICVVFPKYGSRKCADILVGYQIDDLDQNSNFVVSTHIPKNFSTSPVVVFLGGNNPIDKGNIQL